MTDTRAAFEAWWGEDSAAQSRKGLALEAWQAAIKHEREECAKVCEARAMETVPDDSAIDELYFAAAAIRART